MRGGGEGRGSGRERRTWAGMERGFGGRGGGRGGRQGGFGRLWEARCGEGRGPPGVEERGPDEANAGEMPKRSAAPRAEHLPQREAGGGAGPGEGGRREDLAG